MKPDLPPDLRAAYDDPDEAARAARLWDALGDAAPDLSGIPSTEDALAELERRTVEPRATSPRPARNRADRPALHSRRSGHRVRWGLRAAAMLLAVLWLGQWWAQRPVTLSAAPGEQLATTLPDGSTVTLSGGTTLSYASGFRTLGFRQAGTRAVALEGEAFFEVESGERPFEVSTFNAVVSVLGTRFNVKAHARDQVASTQVVLEEGAVRVEAEGETGRSVVLAPGEASEIRAVGGLPTPTTPEAVALDRALAWRDGGFVAEAQPLVDVLRTVERRYGIAITTAPGVPLDRPLTLYFGPRPAEALVHDLALAAGLRVEPRQGGFYLTTIAR
ncbi:MAG: FecR domain-containing protein [Bacteroidota bacterium]